MLHKDFKVWAENSGINLDHHDDYKEWYRCWANGFNSALQLYSIWKDGTQRIGCMEKSVHELFINEGF